MEWFSCVSCSQRPTGGAKILPCFHFICSTENCQNSLLINGKKVCPQCTEEYDVLDEFRDAIEEENVFRLKNRCCEVDNGERLYCKGCNITYCEVCFVKHQGIPVLRKHAVEELKVIILKCVNCQKEDAYEKIETGLLKCNGCSRDSLVPVDREIIPYAAVVIRKVLAYLKLSLDTLVARKSELGNKLKVLITKKDQFMELSGSLGVNIPVEEQNKLLTKIRELEEKIKSLHHERFFFQTLPFTNFLEDYLQHDSVTIKFTYERKYKWLADKLSEKANQYLEIINDINDNENSNICDESKVLNCVDQMRELNEPIPSTSGSRKTRNANDNSAPHCPTHEQLSSSSDQIEGHSPKILKTYSLAPHGRGEPSKLPFKSKTKKSAPKIRFETCSFISKASTSGILSRKRHGSIQRTSPRKVSRRYTSFSAGSIPSECSSVLNKKMKAENWRQLEKIHYAIVEKLEDYLKQFSDKEDGQDGCCAICIGGGDLIMCDSDSCTKAFHTGELSKNYEPSVQQSCHVPQIKMVPSGKWQCFFCLNVDTLDNYEFIKAAEKIYYRPSKSGIYENFRSYLIACKFVNDLLKDKTCLVVRCHLEEKLKNAREKTQVSTLNTVRDRLLNFGYPYESFSDMIGDLEMMMIKADSLYNDPKSRDFGFFHKFKETYEETKRKYREKFCKLFRKI